MRTLFEGPDWLGLVTKGQPQQPVQACTPVVGGVVVVVVVGVVVLVVLLLLLWWWWWWWWWGVVVAVDITHYTYMSDFIYYRLYGRLLSRESYLLTRGYP